MGMVRITGSTTCCCLEGPICVVIAHPDDESMFFAPSIVSLVRAGQRVLILCLSSGNFYGLGETRKRELTKACAVLGVPEVGTHTAHILDWNPQEEDVSIVEHRELQDGSREPWPAGVVASYVRDFVEKRGVNTILTFDKQGVSGHADHSAVYRGVVRFLQDQKEVSRGNLDVPAAFELVSTGLLRKYSGLLDLPLSLLLVRWRPFGALFLSVSPRRAWRAMAAHYSQFVWYRRLFVIFSRYAYMNTFRRIPRPP